MTLKTKDSGMIRVKINHALQNSKTSKDNLVKGEFKTMNLIHQL